MPNPDPENVSSAEQNLGVVFRDKSLLQQALLHASRVNEHEGLTARDSNRRLAFHGDATLSHAIVLMLNRHEGLADVGEGILTIHRQKLVNGQTLAEIAGELRLGECLLLGKGEESSAGRSRISNLEDALEAVIGAIELDRGFEAALAFVEQHFGPRLRDLLKKGGDANDT